MPQFRGSELSRLIVYIVLLGVLGVFFVRARDPEMWRWIARDDTAADNAPSDHPSVEEPLPEASGPTDEDPEQATEAQEEFQVLVDGGLTLQKEEMEPYDRLVEWVKNQSFERLYRRAEKKLRYSNLHDEAPLRRGQLVALDVDVRIAEDAGENRYGVPLHVAWAVTDESRGRLYSLVVVDYPPDMPTGFNIHAKAKFAGYFLKLQGYEPGTAKPGQAPEKAPLLIGRVKWSPPPAAVPLPQVDRRHEWIFWGTILGLIGLALVVRFVYRKLRPPPPPVEPLARDPGTGDVIPIEQWLEHADFPPDDRGNNVERGGD